ncbi:MAG TPA: intradiol ring-cleavage dioxygenase [Burkholderiaceae bacterium]|jgi:protocatechuate 3,4-dioxygenase beta subunit|nr:intradiol ring-cleavage dioxygenase [Burkholderiaceae bacterium]
MNRPNNAMTLQRRHFLVGAAGSLITPLAASQTASGALRLSPSQTLGPFYPRNATERPAETDADLLRIEGDRALTKGVPIYLTGRVLDRRAQPLSNAAVEIWQCDANAVYHHPAGGAETERDSNFQGYGIARTDAAGAFHFRTIKPIAYPGRTPHIHVRVQAPNVSPFATQLYLPDDPNNRRDFLFARMSADEQAALTLKFEPTAAATHALARATQLIARVDLVVA